MTDNEIIKALEQRIKDLPCIHEKYEPACGMWCEHLHMWCIDFNNKSLKEKCSEYKPCCSMSLEKQALDLINRLQQKIKDYLLLPNLAIQEPTITELCELELICKTLNVSASDLLGF